MIQKNEESFSKITPVNVQSWPLTVLFVTLIHFKSSSFQSYICFKGMSSVVWLVGCMSEHIKPFRLFHAKHLFPICCGWASVVGLSRAPAPAQAVTSSEDPTHQSSYQWSGGEQDDDSTPDKRIALIMFFSWCLCGFKLDYHPLVLKLVPVNFKKFFLFCSAQKKLSFHKDIHQRKLCSMTWIRCCEPAAAVITKGPCQLSYFLLSFLIHYSHIEKSI